jgi:osmoprotectant transport system ATP-binding protein
LADPADDFVASFVGADRGRRVLHVEETPEGAVLVDGDGRAAGVLSGPPSGGSVRPEAKAATVPVAGAPAQGEDAS